jgi:hypothetical protein
MDVHALTCVVYSINLSIRINIIELRYSPRLVTRPSIPLFHTHRQ